MIERLQNKEHSVAIQIHSVFQLSYAVEAKLLKAADFPPLKRPIESYANSRNDFFGYWKNDELAGVIEIEHNSDFTSINSLVVHPKYFRQGIGRALIEFVLNAFDSDVFTVETGVENDPAIQLYIMFDFHEIKQWDTEFGIRKIRFERRINR